MRRKCVKDQVIVITGGGSGLGQRMAEMFALDLGARVAILDIDQSKALAVVADIQNKGGKANAWHCNVADAKSMQLASEEVEKNFGQVDIVICNAAILHFGHTLQLSTQELQQGVNVNLMGTINTIRAFMEQMEIRNSGQIVAVSSIAGYFGRPMDWLTVPPNSLSEE
uniref:Uncharacterized protein n=1 Tax=Ditylenchus dipsaci TaxID=166011 RepID=A0A915DAE6_9BILA